MRKNHNYPFIRVNFVLLLCLTVPFFCGDFLASAQDFPDWMEDVEFERSKHIEINAPQMPLDPETGKPASKSRSGRYRFRKPDLPDLSVIREKAVKAQMKKQRESADSLNEAFEFSVNNIEYLRSNRSRLLKTLDTFSNPADKEIIQGELDELDKTIKAAVELKKIFGLEPDGKSVAEMDPRTFQRAQNLAEVIFGSQTNNKDLQLKEPKPLFDNIDQHKLNYELDSSHEKFIIPKARPSIYKERQRELKEKREQEKRQEEIWQNMQ